MRQLFWLTLIVLLIGIVRLADASVIVASTYHESVIKSAALLAVPSIALGLSVFAMRRSTLKSAVALFFSLVLLWAINSNCKPIFHHPDDLFFPFIALLPVDVMIALWLILALIMVHFLEILFSRKEESHFNRKT